MVEGRGGRSLGEVETEKEVQGLSRHLETGWTGFLGYHGSHGGKRSQRCSQDFGQSKMEMGKTEELLICAT